jgi:hypothetical protein
MGMPVASPDLTSAQIDVILKGMNLKTEVQLNKCEIRAGNVTGCHDCERGAKLNLVCTTDFGNSLANIICPSAKSFAQCTPKGREKIVSLHFSRAEIDEECEVFCGSSSTRFKLQGLLNHPEEDVSNDWRQAKRTWIKELHDVDFRHLFSFLMFPRMILIFIGSLVLLFILLYCLFPFIIRFYVSGIFNLLFPRSVVTDDLHSKIV